VAPSCLDALGGRLTLMTSQDSGSPLSSSPMSESESESGSGSGPGGEASRGVSDIVSDISIALVSASRLSICQAKTVTQAVLRRESWTAQWGRGLPTAPPLPGGRQRLVLPCRRVSATSSLDLSPRVRGRCADNLAVRRRLGELRRESCVVLWVTRSTTKVVALSLGSLSLSSGHATCDV